MADQNEQAPDQGRREINQAKDQVQFLLERLGQLGNSTLQVRIEGAGTRENQVAEQFVEGCMVLMRRYGAALVQAAEDSATLDDLEHHIGNNPGVDLVVPEAVIESTLAADETAPLRVIVAHLTAMQDADGVAGAAN